MFVVILVVAFSWLMRETEVLSIHLLIGREKEVSISIDNIMQLALGMIFIAVGLILCPIKIHKPFPAILISPVGNLYYDFNLNQARHIITRLYGWKCYPQIVELVSPLGIKYHRFNAIEAERICRKYDGWEWDTEFVGIM